MELTEEQRREWEKWLSEKPENVREVAEKIVPWKRYRDKRITNDTGNRYSPRSYEEGEDGSVTITCEKSNDRFPILGGHTVFGMSADDLEESE